MSAMKQGQVQQQLMVLLVVAKSALRGPCLTVQQRQQWWQQQGKQGKYSSTSPNVGACLEQPLQMIWAGRKVAQTLRCHDCLQLLQLQW